jgi:hypothetical protein
LHKEKLHELDSSPNIAKRHQIEEDEMVRACHPYGGENRNAQRVLALKPYRKQQLGRPRRQWKYNIKIDLKETIWDYSS